MSRRLYSTALVFGLALLLNVFVNNRRIGRARPAQESKTAETAAIPNARSMVTTPSTASLDDPTRGRSKQNSEDSTTSEKGEHPSRLSSDKRNAEYRTEISRYGTRVIPFARTGGVGWDLEFGHERRKKLGDLSLLLDQSRTSVQQGDSLLLRISWPAQSVDIGDGEVRAATRSTAEPPIMTASFRQSAGRASGVLSTGKLAYGDYRVDVPVFVAGTHRSAVSFFFEVVSRSRINNLGIIGASTSSGHIELKVGVQTPRSTHLQVVARLSTPEGEPLAILRGEASVPSGTAQVPILIPGAFVQDSLAAGTYRVHDVEVLEVRPGTDVSQATPWRGSFDVVVPANANWSDVLPLRPDRTVKYQRKAQSL